MNLEFGTYKFIYIGLLCCLVSLSTIFAGDEGLYKQEQEVLLKFRPMVGNLLYRDYMSTDKYLIKWLKSSGMDLGKAKDKLSKAHAWRQKNKVDEVLDEDFSKIYKHCPLHTNIIDREGRPVFLVSLQKCSMRKLAITGSRQENQRYLIKTLESLSSQLYQNGTSDNVTNCGVVADLNGFNLRQHACLSCIPYYIEFVSNYDSYYPDTLKYVILINTQRTTEVALNTILAPFSSRLTVDEVRVHGFNKAEWSKDLLKLIPPDQLTREYGGTRRTFDD